MPALILNEKIFIELQNDSIFKLYDIKFFDMIEIVFYMVDLNA